MPNRPGTLANICSALGDKGINIEAISLSTSLDWGTLRLVTDDPSKTKETLQSMGITFVETDVMSIQILNEPGEIAKRAKSLADSGINIGEAYFSGLERGTKARLIFTVSDIERASKILE
jgi:hypothetical protein